MASKYLPERTKTVDITPAIEKIHQYLFGK